MATIKQLASVETVRAWFDSRFRAIEGELRGIRGELADFRQQRESSVAGRARAVPETSPEIAARLQQVAALERIDLTDHNGAVPKRPQFTAGESQAVSSAQCDDAAYLRWSALLLDATDPLPPEMRYNRKVWEWAYIAQCASESGVLQAGRRALGFGVGTEPLPALFASRGMEVIATDQPVESGQHWADTGELMGDRDGLARPHLIDGASFDQLVLTKRIDMNAVPDNLGAFDLIWSSCVIEHLGSPRLGLDFVRNSCRMLQPGGIAVHTTELELTPRSETADYGHCAVYRPADLRALAETLQADGLECVLNLTVPMDTAADRWISLVTQPNAKDLPDQAHLKLVLGDSVSTSFALVVRRPPA